MFYGTIVMYEVGGFGEVIGKFKDIESCTTYKACGGTNTGEIYIILF